MTDVSIMAEIQQICDELDAIARECGDSETLAITISSLRFGKVYRRARELRATLSQGDNLG